MFLLKCLNDIILYHCHNDGSSKYSTTKRNFLYKNTYNYITFLCKELPKLPIQIITSWLSLTPRMPRYFIDQLIDCITNISSLFNIQDDKYYKFHECDSFKDKNYCFDQEITDEYSTLNSNIYQTCNNLIRELNTILQKQYKCKNKDKCDYCGISDTFDSLNSCN